MENKSGNTYFSPTTHWTSAGKSYKSSRPSYVVMKINFNLTKPKLVVKTTKHREIRIPPRLTLQLAELVGIHFGDGGIHVRKRKSYLVTYTFNAKENALIEDTRSFFKELFDIELKSVSQKNATQFYCSSKMLCYFFHENFGAPLGKKDHLSIPPIIKQDDKYVKAFLKGLFRTDGCLYFTKGYPIIKITNKCKEFTQEIKYALLEMGFRANVYAKGNKKHEGYDVVLCGHNQLVKWRSEILNGDTGIRTQIYG